MAEYQLSKEEYVSACRGLAANYRLRAMLFVWMIYLLLTVVRTMMASDPVTVATTYLIGGVVAFLIFLGLSRFRDGRVAKGYETQASLRELIKAEIDEKGIQMTHETGSNFLAWERVVKWVETEEFFLLFESHLFARILPKRALSKEETAVVREKTAGVKKG